MDTFPTHVTCSEPKRCFQRDPDASVCDSELSSPCGDEVVLEDGILNVAKFTKETGDSVAASLLETIVRNFPKEAWECFYSLFKKNRCTNVR